MHKAIELMLAKYNCRSESDYSNAIKEIFQEIALLGLWRAKFFEHAAFYGGTALRILYQLDRFSEDLDFSLLKPNLEFNLDKYNKAISDELSAFGFEVEVTSKEKNIESTIESAFIKANTIKQFIAIEVPANITQTIHGMRSIKIKMEVDTNPPGNFLTEAKIIYHPIPFSVVTMKPEDLFAGKLHAILCRQWQTRVKGRDWYDLVWYITQDIAVNLIHLETMLKQSGHLSASAQLDLAMLNQLLRNKITELDFNAAKKDVVNFLPDPAAVEIWSKEFFLSLVTNIKNTQHT